MYDYNLNAYRIIVPDKYIKNFGELKDIEISYTIDQNSSTNLISYNPNDTNIGLSVVAIIGIITGSLGGVAILTVAAVSHFKNSSDSVEKTLLKN